MADNHNRTPVIVWLRMTDYMHGWLQHELGCSLRVRDQKVVCVQHLPGAKDVFMGLTADVSPAGDASDVGNCMSDTRKNCILSGLDMDEKAMLQEYGITRDAMKLFVPIECPKMCLTKDGVLRPWTLNVALGRTQATAMQRLLRTAFWDAVAVFDKAYANRMGGKKYPAVDMVEAFCMETDTPDMYAESIRREWQRRQKREKK